MYSIIVFWNHITFDSSNPDKTFYNLSGLSKIINVTDNLNKSLKDSPGRLFIEKELIYSFEFIGYSPIEIIQELKPYETNIFRVINRNFKALGHSTSFDDVSNYYHKTLYYIYTLTVTENIKTCIFFDTPHHPFDYIAFLYFKIVGVKTYVTKKVPSNHSGDFFNRRFITSNFPYLDSNFDYYYSSFKNNNDLTPTEDLERYIIEYSSKNEVIYNKQHLGTRWSIFYIANYLLKKTFHYLLKLKIKQILIKSKKYFYRLIIDQQNRSKILKHYTNHSISANFNNKYIYFPLQYQPEASTIPLGNEFSNQELAINYILRNSQEDLYIYVREHPAYWHKISNTDRITDARTFEFYNRLIINHRIKLIDIKTNHLLLIKHSLAVATITGTVAFEAFGLNKTVFTFGEYIYSTMANSIQLPSKKGEYTLSNLTELNYDYSSEFKATLLALERISIKINHSKDKTSLSESMKDELVFIIEYILNQN
jgi:hypothetical protein